jgi:hypothetical protein
MEFVREPAKQRWRKSPASPQSYVDGIRARARKATLMEFVREPAKRAEA